jgi:cytochrome P450
VSSHQLRDLSNQEFDPYVDEDQAFGSILNPWPVMAELRARSPVSNGEYRTFFGAPADPSLKDFKHYTVWGYDEVNSVLSNPRMFSSAIAHRISVEPAFGRILVVMDPPEHSRLRPFLQQVFSPRRVKQWTEQVIRPQIHALIDRFAPNGQAELVSQFTQRYPFEAVYQLLGLPHEDLELFQKLAVTQTFALSEFVQEAKEAGNSLAEYLIALSHERREHPGEDLISLVATAEIEGERLDQDVVVGFLRHILNAAADTSYRTTGSLLVALLSDSALLGAIREDRSLVPLAIEETLRWEGPVVSNFRTLTGDYELAGVPMKAGAVVHAVQGAANRDPRKFDRPDEFNVTRSRLHRHLGFGAGPHSCLGMQLAREQIREAINALVDRLPELQRDPNYPAPVIKGFNFRKPTELRVKFN